MSDGSETKTAAAERERLAASWLMENSSLRDALTDGQAERLLNWALDQLGKVARETAGMPASSAQESLDRQADHIAALMRGLNRFIADLRHPSALEEGDPTWHEKMIADLRAFKGGEPSAAAYLNAEALQLDRSQLDADTAFERLLQLIRDESTPSPHNFVTDEL